MLPIDLLRKYQIKYTGEDAITNNEIAPSAGIDTTKLAEGNMFFKKDGSVAATGTFDLGGNRITNGQPAINPNDFVTLSQLLSLLPSTYIFNQPTPSTVWTITHNLNRYPSVTVVDTAGTIIETETIYSTPNTIIINFNSANAGKAYLN